ncbi:unnamed protein product, partial [Chrysoparadoxa australica]
MEGLDVKAEEEVIIGIDLGTTYSCVAAWDKATDRPKVLPSSTGQHTTPSYVAFTGQARVVGQPAKSQAPSNPRNTVYDAKRIIGRGWHDEVVQAEMKRFPFKVVEEAERPVIEVEWMGETKRLSPEEISATVLTEMKRAAERALGHPVKSAVITVPAHFNDGQRQATKDAGRIAGLDVRRIINEPTAAALAYGLHSDSSNQAGEVFHNNVVIFDLGGGTFDVSVLSMEGGVFEVKATGGDTHLGGEDFDNNLVEWVVQLFQTENDKQTAQKLRKSNRAMRRIQTACENAKRALSSSPSAHLELDSLIDGKDFACDLTRETFEKLNEALFASCIETVKEVLADAQVAIGEVSDIVLVGGSTRVPALQSKLRSLVGGRIELCRSINPDEAVAVGAAVQGRILAMGGSGGGQNLLGGFSTDLVLLDVTPLSLGIELEGREMSTLIKRNTPIPCKKARVYTTVSDFQTSLDVVVYEGERKSIDACHKLGEFTIHGIEKAKQGEPKIEVSFSLDANGILHVTAKDEVTGAAASAEIAAKDGRLSDQEVDRMVAEAEKYRQMDEQYTQKLQLVSALEEGAYKAMSIARERKDDAAVSMLDNLRDWLDYDAADCDMEAVEERATMLLTNFG